MRYRNSVLFLLLFGTLLYGSLPPRISPPSEDEVLRESLGMVAAQSLYATYLAIGAICDGTAQNVYDRETADPLLLHLNRISDAMAEQMGKLLSSGLLEGEDVTAVQRIMDANLALSAQARAYRDFMRTGNRAHTKIYEEKRKDAWARIKIILNIEE